MPQKDKAVINMGDFSLIHVQPEFQTTFEHTSTLIPDGFCLYFRAFDQVLKLRWILLFQYQRSFRAFPLR